ncbi:MAG TPA: hypothetical protein VND15_03740 [Candidatus Acidoferrales bacterium]|nr:hypothetical protein [Candidatus Acidoferrales bacterium]
METESAGGRLSEDVVRLRKLEHELSKLELSKHLDPHKLAGDIINAEAGIKGNILESVKRNATQFAMFAEFAIQRHSLAEVPYKDTNMAHIIVKNHSRNEHILALASRCPVDILLSQNANGINLLTSLAEATQKSANRVITDHGEHLLTPNRDGRTPAYYVADKWENLLGKLLLDKNVANSPEGAEWKVLFRAYMKFPDKVLQLARNPIYNEVFDFVLNQPEVKNAQDFKVREYSNRINAALLTISPR